MLKYAVFALALLFFLLLYIEARRAARDRAALSHVVHVNGTRGKSTVTRLIAAGLRAGGMRVVCKTTGTVPVIIDADNAVRPIRRRGRSNIKEQLSVLHFAAQQRADVLAVECMAVLPALQSISQHRMLRADVGVITNVRIDHTDVMGETLPEICDALSNTIPKNGVLFTADAGHFEQLSHNALPLGARVVLARDDKSLPDFEFSENLSLALAVCEHLGVERAVALEGMRSFRRDPYALSAHRIGDGIFINAMSANDPQSTLMTYEALAGRLNLSGCRLILLVNNRLDRPSRTRDMIDLAVRLSPDEIRIMGAYRRYMKRCLLRRLKQPVPILLVESAAAAAPRALRRNEVLFAAGNIAGPGKALMDIVKKEGNRLV